MRAAPSRTVLELAVRGVRERPPGRDLDRPQRLRLPLVADPGDDPLIENRVADRAAPVAGPQVGEHPRRSPARERGCPARACGSTAHAARAPARSTAVPRSATRAARARGGLAARHRAARASTARSSAGGCAGRSRRRTSAGGSSRPLRPRRSRLPSSRSPIRPTCARGFGVSTSSFSPTSGCRRRAARWRASPSGIAAG